MSNNNDYRAIWERRDDETDLQYERFRAYLAMKNRNMSELARQLDIRPPDLRDVGAAKNWRERAAAYDRWVLAEIDRANVNGAIMAVNNTKRRDRDPMLEEYEKMRVELWEIRAELLAKVRKMLTFEVGTSTKSARKAFRVKNPETKQSELNIVSEVKTDPRWTWGDVAKITEMIDRLGQEIISMPPEVVKLLPEFCYELRRNGFDVAAFMQNTIDKLKAS